MIAPADLQAILLTLKLAGIVTVILVILGLPLAWWLVRSHAKVAVVVGAMVTVPLILPPTVLGFYLLMVLGPEGVVGEFTQWLGLGILPFTFWGLVIASLIYSLPFAVQPIQAAFEAIPKRTLEAASTLRATPVDSFFCVVLPLSKNGILTAAILTFAHTVGEFGVILMIGGNIPGETQVVSVQIYDHVESLAYDNAHNLSLLMLGFSLSVLILLQVWKKNALSMASDLKS